MLFPINALINKNIATQKFCIFIFLFIKKQLKERWSLVKRILALLIAGLMLLPMAVMAEPEKITIYVSPDGDDCNQGTIEKPIKSLRTAINAASQHAGKRPVEVIFRGGHYKLTDTIKMHEGDSGTEEFPVVYKAMEGETPYFSAATEFTLSQMEVVTDEKILARLPKEVRGKVMQMDLKKLGINYLDELCANGYKFGKTGDDYIRNIAYLVADNRYQMLSQWPNGDYNYDHYVGIIKNGSTSYLSNDGGIFEYEGSHPDRWETADDMYIASFCGYDFRLEYSRIKNIDKELRRITLANGTSFGVRNPNGRFKAMNLLEEIDIPSEWYLDRKTMMVYYYPPQYLNEDSVIEITTMFKDAIQMKGTRWVRFENLGFRCFGNDAIYMEGTENIELRGCDFSYIGGRAIASEHADVIVSGTKGGYHIYKEITKGIRIKECNFKYIGFNAISLNAGNEVTLENYPTEISNCVFYKCNTGPSASVITGYGIGTEIKNNSIHNAQHHALGYGRHNVKVQYNDIYNVLHDVMDAGAVYLGRVWNFCGNEISYNLIYDYEAKTPGLHQYVYGIYLDDTLSGQTVHHNILHDGGSGILVGGGAANNVHDNIVVDMSLNTLMYDARGETWDDTMWAGLKKNAEGSWFYSAEFKKQYPFVKEIVDNFTYINPKSGNVQLHPGLSVVKDNVTNGVMSIEKSVYEYSTVENNVDKVDKSIFVNPEKNDYRIRSDSEFAKNHPNALTEKNFSYDMIGPFVNEFRDSVYVSDEKGRQFSKLYPTDNQAGVDPQETSFHWDFADDADDYLITIAKDKEFTDIVLEERVHRNFIEVNQLLEINTDYYWKVRAINTSDKNYMEWDSDDAPFMFTTSPYAKLNKDALEGAVINARSTVGKIVEGTESGTFKEGAKEGLEKIVKEAEKVLTYEDWEATQDIIDKETEKVLQGIQEVGTKLNIVYENIDFMVNNGVDGWLVNDDKFSPVYNGEEVILGNPSSLGTDSNPVYTSKIMPDMNNVICFKMKFDYNGNDNAWLGLAHRQQKVDYLWTDIGFSLVIKKDVIELQQRPNVGIVKTIDNTCVPNDEWVDVEFGAINTPFGTRFLFKVNEETIFDEILSTGLIDTKGYFTIMLPAKDTTVTIKNDADIEAISNRTDLSGVVEKKAPQLVGMNNFFENSEAMNIVGDNATLENNELVIKNEGIENNPPVLTKNVTLPKNNIYEMQVCADPGDGIQAVSLRNQAVTEPDIKKVDNYTIQFTGNKIKLVRYSTKGEEILSIKENDGIYTPGKFFDLRCGVLDTNSKGNRVIVYIDGELIFDFYDSNLNTNAGGVGFYNLSAGTEFKIKGVSSEGDFVIDDIANGVYVADGEVVQASNGDRFIQKAGTWTTGNIGANGKNLMVGEGENPYLDFNAPTDPGFYKIYAWVGKAEDGDKNVEISTVCLEGIDNNSFVIDCSEGNAGWEYIGTVCQAKAGSNVLGSVKGSGQGKVYIGGFKFITTDEETFNASRLYSKDNKVTVLRQGNRTAFINGNEYLLSTAPVEVNNRTLVPIRFISEAIGAKVSWDNNTSSATIVSGSDTIVIKQDSTSYTVNGVSKTMDQPATLINNRILVPIRIISEELKKSVYWDDSGKNTIIISDREFITDELLPNVTSMSKMFKDIE